MSTQSQPRRNSMIWWQELKEDARPMRKLLPAILVNFLLFCGIFLQAEWGWAGVLLLGLIVVSSVTLTVWFLKSMEDEEVQNDPVAV